MSSKGRGKTWIRSSFQACCAGIRKYSSGGKILLAVVNLVACLTVDIWSLVDRAQLIIATRASLISEPVPNDPCDGVRIFQEELLHDNAYYMIAFGLYSVLDIIAAFLMAYAIGDTKKERHVKYTLWLGLQLFLLYYVFLHAFVIISIGKMFEEPAWDHMVVIAWKISLLIIFNTLHLAEMYAPGNDTQTKKKVEEKPLDPEKQAGENEGRRGKKSHDKCGNTENPPEDKSSEGEKVPEGNSSGTQNEEKGNSSGAEDKPKGSSAGAEEESNENSSGKGKLQENMFNAEEKQSQANSKAS